MRSSFIFCLLAMYYIVSASAKSCSMEMTIPSVPCRSLCLLSNGGQELTKKGPETSCKMPGGKTGKCKDGECETKLG
uniref:Putative salivary kunitz domain protein n=1 Tax=Ixodes ricinus TaxID=34613 RepID=A0A0K8R6Q2_IXORI